MRNEVQEALAELLDLAHAELDGLKASTPTDLILGGILASTSENCAAILQLSDGLAARSCEIILRSVVDAWITAYYIVGDESGGRAKSYAARSNKGLRDYYRRLRSLMSKDPSDAIRYLARAQLASEGELRERIGALDAEAQKIRREGVKPFPSLAGCAQQLSPEFEYLYLWFYGYLLSDRVHLGPRTVLAYLDKEEYDPTARKFQVRKAVATALALHQSLLRLASNEFGHPTEEQLSKFDAILEQEKVFGRDPGQSA